jgi:hypothetical protein
MDPILHIFSPIICVFSQCIKLLGLVRRVIFLLLPQLHRHVLYFTTVRYKFEYASVVWNSIMCINANELETAHQNVVALCFNNLLSLIHYSDAYALEHLKFHGRRDIMLVNCSLFKFTLLLNFSFPFWKLLVFEFLIGISETFLCSLFVVQVKISILLNALQVVCRDVIVFL